MELKNLMVDTKSAWIAYPGLDGFEVHVVNLGREKMNKLRKDSIVTKIDRKTRHPYEELDEKKFVRAFTDASVVDWKGLKLAYLEELMLVDIEAQDPDKELPYSQDNAELLVSNSGAFDTWLNEVIHDLDNFRSKRNRGNVAEAGEVAE